MNTKSYKDLDQFDNEDGDYSSLGAVAKPYGKRLGDFLIIFSGLEHVLNLVTSSMISESSHDFGYRILKTLRMEPKIEFLHGLLLNFISVTGQTSKEQLFRLTERLKNVNTFRNKVSHANWGTLSKSGMVRTKITTDSSDGSVKFEYVKITPRSLMQMTREANRLITEIDDYFMESQNALN